MRRPIHFAVLGATLLVAVTVVATTPLVSEGGENTHAIAAEPPVATQSVKKGTETGVQTPVACSMLWRVDPSGGPASFPAQVSLVANEIKDLVGIKVTIAKPDTPEIPETTTVDITWDLARGKGQGPQAYAWAARAISAPVITQSSITFTSLSLDKTEQMLRNILRHEVGHILGLPHTSNETVSTMSTVIYRLNVIESRGQSPWTPDVKRQLGIAYENCK